MMKLLGILLLIAGGYVAIFNWTAPLLSRRYGRNISIVPLIGAGLLALGLLCLNVPARYLWIPAVADLGTLMLLLVIPWALHEAWVYCPLRRIRRFVARDRSREIRIDLFRGGHARIWCTFNIGANEHFGMCPAAFSYVARWRGSDDSYELFEYGGERRLTLNIVDGVFESSESRDADSANLKYDTLNGIRFTDPRDA